ncbi:hypothetical protein B0H13DRAFT_1862141 [Mycena leptocephala]|nr:hypothetical protein B0H13DRAFT_1862141 [Mycena leptocephala]
MDREPPASPDYFGYYGTLDPALYKSPSELPQPPGAPSSPSPHRPLKELISSESGTTSQEQVGPNSQPSAQAAQLQFVPYVPITSANNNSESLAPPSNVFPITFVGSEAEVPAAHRGRPLNIYWV